MEQDINKNNHDRLLNVINTLVNDSGKTDIDSQIKAIETLNDNLIKTPLFFSIIDSLKELRGIKKNHNYINKKDSVKELCKKAFQAGAMHCATEGKVYSQSDDVDTWLIKMGLI